MRTTKHAARGLIPLAVLLFTLAISSGAVMGEGTLRIDQAISPNEIYVAGTEDEVTSALLTLSIEVVGPAVRYPIDCMFVVDVSATSDLDQARAFAYDVIDQLGVDDRAGLISYGTTARLDIPLTHNLGAVKLAIADLAASGKSAMGLALQMGRREFEQIGRENALFVEILISDGQSSVGVEPDEEGEAAAELGIKMIPVGLGTLINRNLLISFAEETGGQFFESPSEQARTELINGLDVHIAARDVRVEKRLPEEVRMVDAWPEPTQVELHSTGASTIVWRLEDLALGDATSIQVELEALQGGIWETDMASTILFDDFRGVPQVAEIPSRLLTGIEPNRPPIASFVVATETPLSVHHDVEFEDTSIDDDGDVVAWKWDFDDGATSTERHPSHRFEDGGTYVVSLVATDEDGDASDPYEMEIAIEPNRPPVASFDVTGEPPYTIDRLIGFEDASFDEDGEVVARKWDFGDGATSDEQDPEHRFDDDGTFVVSLVAIDDDGKASEPFETEVEIEPNKPPVASFDIEDDGVVDTVDPVRFEDTSFDEDGEVAAWEWDFGDGTTSTEQHPEHRYHNTGTFTVSLVAIDASGKASRPAEADIVVELGPRVTATRTIETCLPNDQTIPGATVSVVLVIDIEGTLNGLAVMETLPPGWTFVEEENDGATMRKELNTVEWLFVEQLMGDRANAQREIRYFLEAPAEVASVGESAEASIQGSIASSSPRFEQPILGEDKLAVTPFLSVPVVISRWDAEAGEVRLCEAEPKIIDFAEIQYAISLWLSGDPVPQTDGLTIDIDMMQELIGYWLTGRSVHDSLP